MRPQMRCRDERGQALVLACLLLLVICIAVLTTVNLGHAVTERVRIQNNADAAAYSMAALEARAFNFYAFANRTQASHYVSAMVWQSTDSFLYFVEAMLTDVYGVMRTLNRCSGKDRGVFWNALCPILEAMPYVGPVLRALSTLIGLYRNLLFFFQESLAALNPDAVIGREIIPSHRMLNGVLAASSRAVMEATLQQLLRVGEDVVRQNDPNVKVSAQHPVGALVACLFDRAHVEEANGSPFKPADAFTPIDPRRVEEGDRAARAKRSMAQVANASRFACEQPGCRAEWVTSRTAALIAPPGWFGPLKGFLAGLPKLGQTRLLSYRLARGMPGQGGVDENRPNNLRQWRQITNNPIGVLGQGDALGADDTYRIGLGPPVLGVGPAGLKNPLSCAPDDPLERCWGDPREEPVDRLKTSIFALSSGDLQQAGIHWRLVRPGTASDPSDREVGLNRHDVCVVRAPGPCPLSVQVYVANVRIDPADSNHSWEGLMPFSHFEPGQYERSCGQEQLDRWGVPSTARAAGRASEFNQPSTWSILHKGPDELRNPLADPTATRQAPALLNERAELSVGFGGSTANLVLENRRQASPGFAAGVTGIARAQVYYHRPGNWAEQPNFFNPFWRPRLASVAQGAAGFPLVEELERSLPAELASSPERVLTH